MDLVTLGAALNGAKAQTESYVENHFTAGANITITDNSDGTQTIAASGEISSEDSVARGEIADHEADKTNPHEVDGSQVTLTGYSKASSASAVAATDTTNQAIGKLEKALDGKVDTVSGKGLSSNDFTDTYKSKVDNCASTSDISDMATQTWVGQQGYLTNVDEVPTVTSEDDNKVLKASYSGGVGTYSWQTSGGGGGTSDYSDLTNKPSINSTTLSGNKTSSDLGLQSTIDSSHKLSADLIDDTSATNKFNVQADWNQATDTASDYIKNKPTLGTAAALDVATSGNASTSQVVKGDDTRLTDSRNAADVSSWAKAANKPSYTGSEITLTEYAEAQSKASVAATDTANAAIGKLEYRVETNENNISLKIGASDYATQNTGGTVRVWTTTDGTSTTLHIATEAPTP